MSIVLSSVVAFLASAVLTGSAAWIDLWPWRRSEGRHWTERARKLHPARGALLINLVLIPAVVTLALHCWGPGDWLVLNAVLAYAGAVTALYPTERALHPGLTPQLFARLAFGSAVIRSLRWVTLAAATLCMPSRFTTVAWMLALGYVGFELAMRLGGNMHILVALGLLKPASERLERLVAETSAELGVPVTRARVLVHLDANALAAVASREIWVTSRLLEVAPDDEIKAVCAHELGHLKESRSDIAIRIVRSLIPVPIVLVQPLGVSFGAESVLAMFALMAICWVGLQKWARSKERSADKTAVEYRHDDQVFARALERLHRVNMVPAAFKGQAMLSHPCLYDRLLAANVTPDYPRPAPPPSGGWTSTAIAALLVAVIVSGLPPPSW